MSFAAQMRIGSLEILLALAVFGVIIGRNRFSAVPRAPADLEIELLFDHNAIGVTVSEGHPARVIGRSPEADIRLNDPEASRKHAALQAAGGVLYLTDLGSRNGTFLNGKALSAGGIELKVGDHIDVGNTRLTVAAVRSLS